MPDIESKVQHLLDLEEIRMLLYKYCYYNDGGWPDQPVSHQGPSADLFTEDGVWDGSPIAKAEGREEIRKLFESFATMPMVYHSVTNPIIEIDGDTATGHWHRVGGGLSADGTSTLGMGGYRDRYVRTADGWKIKHMRVIWGPRSTLTNGWEESFPNVK